MKLIKADHDRRLELPGVPGPVRRPVDIDQSRTGFAHLRSLRIYQFDALSVINGHAEEDEVFVVVLSGSVEFIVHEANAEDEPQSFTLSAVGKSGNDPCVAYLSPHSAYRLTPQTAATVAYARATPVSSRPSTVFTADVSNDDTGRTVLLEEAEYAQRLRLQLIQVNAHQGDVAFTPIKEAESGDEALVHFQTIPAEQAATVTVGQDSTPIKSWDTIAVDHQEHFTLSMAKGSSALILVVLAA